VTLLGLGKYKESEEHLRKAIEIDSKHASSWRNLGIVCRRQGKYQAAIAANEHYLQLEPNGAGAQEVRGVLAILRHDQKLAGSNNDDDYFAQLTPANAWRWSSSRMPLKVYVEERSEIAGFRSNYPGLVRDAFADWTKASSGQVTFVFVDHKSAADVVVEWRKIGQWASDIQPEYVEHLINHVTIALVPQVKSEAIAMTNESIKFSALHEIGEALGLPNSTNANDIMFATVVEGSSVTPRISTRDAKTLQKLYGTK
jgi:predicted Zn-dependent protease